jgi:hypothetical protein
MSRPRRTQPSGAGSEVEQVVFCTDALTRNEWVAGILDELRADGGRAEEMEDFLQRCRVGRTNILKKFSATQHEYFLVVIKTPVEGQEYTLCFDRRDRGTGADDHHEPATETAPPPDDPPYYEPAPASPPPPYKTHTRTSPSPRQPPSTRTRVSPRPRQPQTRN